MIHTDEETEFVFPFGMVPKGSRIVIYGAGKKGQSYLQQVLMTKYCDVIAMIDKNAEHYQNFCIPVLTLDEIDSLDFDFAVLAGRFSETTQMFRTLLEQQGVPAQKIIEHQEKEISLFLPEKTGKGQAWRQSPKNMLLYFAGGFGDNIIAKRSVESLLTVDPALCLDIASDRPCDFLQFLYSDTPQVNKICHQVLANYESEKELYQAALFFCGTAWVRVDHLARPSTLSPEIFSILVHLEARTEEERYDARYPAYPYYYRSIYRGENCYLNIGRGILPNREWRVKIPGTAEGLAEFRAMHLGAYVTINYGNGASEDVKKIAKSWPIERFEQFIRLFHEAYPDVEVVQLGARTAHALVGASRHVVGKSFGVVREILAHALLHIDIEGGLVHLASQLGTKCVVLFGPTQAEFFGYPQNVNLKAGTCHECYQLYSKNYNRCARGMEEPECMYSITPQMVMKAATRVLKEKGCDW